MCAENSLAVLVLVIDPDGDPLTRGQSGLPGFCGLTDNGDGTGVIGCDPNSGTSGVFGPIDVMADDGERTSAAVS